MNSLFDREYGYQYTKYEFKCLEQFYKAKINFSNKLTGYLTKLCDYYILRPTITTIKPYIICRTNMEIDDTFVNINGKWDYDINKRCLIFNIDEITNMNIQTNEILQDIISYDRYLEILFGNSMIDEKSKHIIAHTLISKAKQCIKIYIHANNAKRLVDRLRMFIPIEFICMNSIFIEDLGVYMIIKPILSLQFNTISKANLTMDDMYIDSKVEYLHDAVKFIIAMHTLPIDVRSNYDEIKEYIISNYKRSNLINTLFTLGIANAKINKQNSVTVSNIKYIMELLDENNITTVSLS